MTKVTWEASEDVIHEYSDDYYLTIMVDQSGDDEWYGVQTFVKDEDATHGLVLPERMDT